MLFLPIARHQFEILIARAAAQGFVHDLDCHGARPHLYIVALPDGKVALGSPESLGADIAQYDAKPHPGAAGIACPRFQRSVKTLCIAAAVPVRCNDERRDMLNRGCQQVGNDSCHRRKLSGPIDIPDYPLFRVVHIGRKRVGNFLRGLARLRRLTGGCKKVGGVSIEEPLKQRRMLDSQFDGSQSGNWRLRQCHLCDIFICVSRSPPLPLFRRPLLHLVCEHAPLSLSLHVGARVPQVLHGRLLAGDGAIAGIERESGRVQLIDATPSDLICG